MRSINFLLTYLLTYFTDGVAWSVGLSVCLSVTTVSRAKVAEPIVTPFGMLTRVGQGTMY